MSHWHCFNCDIDLTEDEIWEFPLSNGSVIYCPRCKDHKGLEYYPD